MSADPILGTYLNAIADKKIDPNNFALYTYCGNNPLMA
jgi:hypothetical protein